MLEESRIRELRRFECDILDLIDKVRTWGTKKPKVKGKVQDWGTPPIPDFEGQTDRKSSRSVRREGEKAQGPRTWNYEEDNPKQRPRGTPKRWRDAAQIEARPEDPNAPRLPSRNPLVPPTLAIQSDDPPPHLLDQRRKEEVRKTLQQFEALTGVLVTGTARSRSPSPSNETDELPAISVSGKELMTQLSSKRPLAATRPPKVAPPARRPPLSQTASRPPPGLPLPVNRSNPPLVSAPSPVRVATPDKRRSAWRKPPRWSINSTPDRTRGASAKFDEVMGDAVLMDDDGMPALKLVKKVPPKMADTKLNVNAPDWRPPPPGLSANDTPKRQGPPGPIRSSPSKNRPPPKLPAHWGKPKGRQSYSSDRGRYQNNHQSSSGGNFNQGLDLTPPLETFQGVDRWGGGPMPVAPPPRSYSHRQSRQRNNAPPNGPPPNGHWTPSPNKSRSPRSHASPTPPPKPIGSPGPAIGQPGPNVVSNGASWRDEVIEINMEGPYEEEKPPTALSAAAEPFVPQDETLLDQSNGDRLKFRKTHLNKIDEVPETECDIRGGDSEGDPLAEDNAFIDLEEIVIRPVTPTKKAPAAQWKVATSPPRPGTPEEVTSSKSSWLAWRGYAAPILDLSELDDVVVEALPESAYCGSEDDTVVKTPRKPGDAGTNSLIEVTGSDVDTDPPALRKSDAAGFIQINPDLDGVGDEYTGVTEPQLIDEPRSTRRRAPSAPSGSAKPAASPSDRLREFTSDGQEILALVGTFLGLGCK